MTQESVLPLIKQIVFQGTVPDIEQYANIRAACPEWMPQFDREHHVYPIWAELSGDDPSLDLDLDRSLKAMIAARDRVKTTKGQTSQTTQTNHASQTSQITQTTHTNQEQYEQYDPYGWYTLFVAFYQRDTNPYKTFMTMASKMQRQLMWSAFKRHNSYALYELWNYNSALGLNANVSRRCLDQAIIMRNAMAIRSQLLSYTTFRRLPPPSTVLCDALLDIRHFELSLAVPPDQLEGHTRVVMTQQDKTKTIQYALTKPIADLFTKGYTDLLIGSGIRHLADLISTMLESMSAQQRQIQEYRTLLELHLAYGLDLGSLVTSLVSEYLF